jgi:hypothetical protein
MREDSERRPEVVLDAFVPTRQLLGAPGQPLGFENLPLLGAKREEVARAYGSPIRLPPTEFAATDTVVATTVRDGVVIGFAFPLSFRRRPEAREEILKFVDAKWGTGRRASGTPETYAYGLEVRVSEDTTRDAWIVWVGHGHGHGHGVSAPPGTGH